MSHSHSLDWLPSELRHARCVLATLVSAKDRDVEARLEELTVAIASRGGEVVATMLQRRGVSRAKGPGGVEKMNAPLTASTVFGSGKVRDLARLIATSRATLVIVPNALKSSQRERIEDLVRCKVLAPPG